MKRVLVTGGAGHLGSALIRSAPQGVELHATQRNNPVHGCAAYPVDLAEPDGVRELVASIRPDLVIHTAYSMDAGERDILAATRSVVDACAASGCELIHMSTDLLLDGESAPYHESAAPAPVHEYGIWKARAEHYVRETLPRADVIRSSLITSFGSLDPRSAWVADSIRGGTPIHLFVDEIRSPILTEDLAAQLWEIASLSPDRRGGVWHLAGPEALSRYAIGLLVAASERLPAEAITPSSSRTLATPRPRDLRLLTPRADRELTVRPIPLSEAAMATRLATQRQGD